ncbi:jacalin-like lectin domain-containing protein [Tanacetum coccineum]
MKKKNDDGSIMASKGQIDVTYIHTIKPTEVTSNSSIPTRDDTAMHTKKPIEVTSNSSIPTRSTTVGIFVDTEPTTPTKPSIVGNKSNSPVHSCIPNVLNTGLVSYINVDSVVPSPLLRVEVKSKANLRKIKANVPNDADYCVWLPLVWVHEEKYGLEKSMLRNVPWMIRGIPIFLNKWSPFASLLKEDLSHVPVWVKFHDVPLGQINYARILIAINACNGFSDQLDKCKGQTLGADDEGFIEVKKKKSCGNNGGTKNFMVPVKPKTEYRSKAKQPTNGISNSPKTIPFVGTNKASTSIIEEVVKGSKATTSGIQEERQSSTPIVDKINVLEKYIPKGKLVLVDDEGKPLEKHMKGGGGGGPVANRVKVKVCLEMGFKGEVDKFCDTIMSSLKGFEHLKIPLSDIIQATENFSYKYIVERDALGVVYKGELLRQTLAFKRLRDIDESDFCNEIMFLFNLKHQNIVSFIGFCHEDREMILIFDYPTYGSLQTYLSSPRLTWLMRVQICLDTACGLQYLHENPSQRIIHGDLTSDSIQLYENWQAKLRLSRHINVQVYCTRVYTQVLGSSSWYLDPAYMETGVMTKESDIYSFGVLLFEVLCGRQAYMRDKDSKLPFLSLVRRHYTRGTLTEIIDPVLREQIDNASLNIFSMLAYRCLELDHVKRPKISAVVEGLEKVSTLQKDYEISELQQSNDLSFMKETYALVELEEIDLASYDD